LTAALLCILLLGLLYLPQLDAGSFLPAGLVVIAILASAAINTLAMKSAARHFIEMPAGKAVAYAFTIMLLITLAIFMATALLARQAGLLPSAPPSEYLVHLLQVTVIAGVCFAVILRIVYLRSAEHSALQMSQSANLQALQSRIRPHFMFNSMNSVAGLIRNNPKEAERALIDLADLIRVQMADARKLIPLTAEIQICEQYLAIEKLRLGDRLSVHWNVGEIPKGCLIPSLTIQPLLENAVYHGIEPNFGGGVIDIHVMHNNNHVYVIIRNPVPEIGDAPHRKGNKIAMQNIRERLRRHYGDVAYLVAETHAGIYGTKLRIPIITD